MKREIGSDVQHAAHLLREGKLVAFATETVYGLGAHALDERAVARVFAVKQRPQFDPLIVHLADANWIPQLTREWPETAQRLADAFWPGPLTLVVPKQPRVPDLVTAGLGNVALRVPSHPLALELLRLVDLPIAAPSANRFGRLSPTCATHVAESLGGQIEYILDGGPCQVGVESTVVHVHPTGVTLLRPGGVTLESLEAVIGAVQIPTDKTTTNRAALAPGMLDQHYAPQTSLQLIAPGEPVSKAEAQDAGLLTWAGHPQAHDFAAVEVLSARHDLVEAAARLFATLRRLDQMQLRRIYAEQIPNVGLGRAINDRLTRAAAR